MVLERSKMKQEDLDGTNKRMCDVQEQGWEDSSIKIIALRHQREMVNAEALTSTDT